MAKSGLLGSSITKKYWMAFTGLFLVTFLLGHLAGNLQLLNSNIAEAKDQFNEYALFMTTNPMVKILSYVTYFSILFHTFDGILLYYKNRAARPVKYVKEKGSANASWASRNMTLLGTILLVFILVHLNAFWAKMKFGALDNTFYTTANGVEVKDLYTLTVRSFQENIVPSFIYLIAMAALYFHLSHGFQSAFQSLGLNHSRYNGIIKVVGMVLSIAVPLLFAVIPFYLYFVLDKI